MRVLFDQGVPAPLRSFLADEVDTCHERGWSDLSNGELISKAESEYDTFVTTDNALHTPEASESGRFVRLGFY